MTLRWPALVLVALVALTGVVGAWLGYPFDRVWRWLVAVWMVLMAFERFATNRVNLSLSLEQLGPCYLGQPCRWHLRLVNNHGQRLHVRVQAVPPEAFVGALSSRDCCLAPSETFEILVEQTARQLGKHSWPEQPVELRGPFGMANWIRRLPISGPEALENSQGTVSVVEPDVLESARERVAMERSGARAVALRSMGGSEFRSLRSYAPGDPPSAINWKASAKTSKLVVRETETDQQLTLHFVIDCGVRSSLQVGQLDTLSHAVNLAARMGEFANAAGDQFGLMGFAQEPLVQLPAGRGATHFRRFRKALGELSVADAESNPLAAMMATRHLLSQRALVLLVTNLDDPDAAGQLLQATLMLRPQHLPMVVSVEDHAINELAVRRVANSDELYSSLAAQEYQRVTQRTVAQLERMGAVVIQSPPEQLEKRVFERYKALRGQRAV